MTKKESRVMYNIVSFAACMVLMLYGLKSLVLYDEDTATVVGVLISLVQFLWGGTGVVWWLNIWIKRWRKID